MKSGSDIGTLFIEHHPSPNCETRPADCIIDTILIHSTVLNSLNQVIERFSDPKSKVSSHYTIDRDGKIACHVTEEKRAWHAGESKMPDGRSNVNDFSLGIELVNLNDGYDPYPEVQIMALKNLIAAIKSRHPIKHVFGHYEVVQPPGRKSDPKGFDFTLIR